MVESEGDGALGRGKLSQAKRIDLLERDRAQQSRALTELIEKVGKGFSDQQMGQIRAAMREELADAGLRLDDADQQDEAREDFRFLRWLRRLKDGVATKIGNAVLTAAIVVVLAIFGSGWWAWISSGGK